jgi:phage FluMu protein Com
MREQTEQTSMSKTMSAPTASATSPLVGRRTRPEGRPARDSANGEVRCTCHSLLARVVDGHLELKCRRCRHLLLVELTRLSSEGHAVELRLHRPGSNGGETLHVMGTEAAVGGDQVG